MKLGTKAERFLAKHLHEVCADPARWLGEPRLRLLDAYLRGMAAAFRAEHGRDPFSDSPWNSFAAFAARRGFGAAGGAFAGIERALGEGPTAFKRFLALFNEFRAWAQARSCTALLEDARSAAQVRRFFVRRAARLPRGRLAAHQYVIGARRRFDAVVFRTASWAEDDADGMDNRVAIAILDGAV